MMFIYPRLKYCYQAEFLDEEKVLLLSEKKSVLLSGKLYVSVLAQLREDGISVEELVARLEGRVSAAEVLFALKMLHKEGYLTESTPSIAPELCVYWNTMGMDVHTLWQVLEEKPISVQTVGSLSGDVFLQAFEASGIRIASDGVLTVIITDEYEHNALRAINQTFLETARPWMLIKPVGTEFWIGPLFIPGQTGCWLCLQQRLRNNRQIKTFYQAQRQTQENPPFRGRFFSGEVAKFPSWEGLGVGKQDSESPQAPEPTPCPSQEGNCASLRAADFKKPTPERENLLIPSGYSPLSFQTAANLAAIEITKWLYWGRNEQVQGKIISVDTASCATRTHVLVKRPQCEVCGKPVSRKKTPQPITLRDRASYCLVKQGGYREVDFEETIARYQHHVSPITGVVQTLEPYFPQEGSPVHNYLSGYNVALQSKSWAWLRHHLRGSNVGKGRTQAQAKAGALCEAIERYSCTYQGDEPAIITSLQALGAEGIHPNACMNYSEQQYRCREQINQTCTKFYAMVPVPFDEAREMAWTPVYSLTGQGWKYLPSCFCYTQYPTDDEFQQFCYPDTNGNAAGNSLEEAILQGFLELVERDSVALWWYNRLSKPVVDLSSFDDPYFFQMQDYYHSLQRQITVLDLTSDLHIPAFAAISYRTDTVKQEIIFAFGAHLDAKIGVERALIELNQLLSVVTVSEEERAGGRYRTEDAHFCAWLQKAVREEHPYLVPTQKASPKTAADYPELCPPNVHDSVCCCIEIAKKHELEIFILDMTRPDIGLPVVKVIVPGLRHFWKRFAPGRLYDVPVRMGWLDTSYREEDLNPIGIFI